MGATDPDDDGTVYDTDEAGYEEYEDRDRGYPYEGREGYDYADHEGDPEGYLSGGPERDPARGTDYTEYLDLAFIVGGLIMILFPEPFSTSLGVFVLAIGVGMFLIDLLT